MDKRFWAIIGVIIVIFAGVLFINSNHKAKAPGGGSQPTSHSAGAGKKHVTLLEYGDYECPVCQQYAPIVQQVQQKYGDDITLQFRNLPLTQIHPNAFAGARAAEAADLQGKFWQMHDALYQNQNTWAQAKNPVDIFSQIAQQIGLNVTQFKKDFGSSTVNDRINADLAAFAKTGQSQATPTFFLDGKYVKPGPNIDEFAKLIDQEIAAKNK
jgi:protein-disulfide isomerase